MRESLRPSSTEQGASQSKERAPVCPLLTHAVCVSPLSSPPSIFSLAQTRPIDHHDMFFCNRRKEGLNRRLDDISRYSDEELWQDVGRRFERWERGRAGVEPAFVLFRVGWMEHRRPGSSRVWRRSRKHYPHTGKARGRDMPSP